MLAHCNMSTKNIILIDSGVFTNYPMSIFGGNDKNKKVFIVSSKEFKEVSIKADNEQINKAISQIPLQGIIPLDAGPFLSYYNVRTSILYLLFTKTMNYMILRHKKKKFINFASGNMQNTNEEIEGIIGISQSDSVEEIYAYNTKGIISMITTAKTATDEPFIIQKKEEEKDRKTQIQSDQILPQQILSQPEPVTSEESNTNMKILIKKEVDEGMKTLVLPAIESYMKEFQGQFQNTIGHEIATLRNTAQNEITKMKNSSADFDAFMQRMINANNRMTNLLEQQIKEISDALGNSKPSEPRIEHSPFAMPVQPGQFGGYQMGHRSEMGALGKPPGLGYPPGLPSRPPGI